LNTSKIYFNINNKEGDEKMMGVATHQAFIPQLGPSPYY